MELPWQGLGCGACLQPEHETDSRGRRAGPRLAVVDASTTARPLWRRMGIVLAGEAVSSRNGAVRAVCRIMEKRIGPEPGGNDP